MKPKIFVTRPLPAPVLERLAAPCDLEYHPQDTPLSTAQMAEACREVEGVMVCGADRKSTRLNSSHLGISYAVFCLKKKKNKGSRAEETDALGWKVRAQKRL